jgi:hypothetical protein
MSYPLVLGFALLSAFSALPAQAVHQVGPGGFATIQEAVDVAADGDVIRIAPGSYGAVIARCGLRFLGGGGVDIAGLTLSMAAGQHTELNGIDMQQGGATPATNITIWGGSVSISDCNLAMGPGGLLLINAAVTMRHCTASTVAGDCCTVILGHLSASECSFTALAPSANWLFAACVHAVGGTIQLSHCAVRGADATGAPAAEHAMTALRLDSYTVPGTPETWLSDCTLTGGSATNGNPGAPALGTNGVISLQRCSLTGGTGSTGQAPATEGIILPGRLLSVASTTGPLQLGGVLQLDFTAASQDLVVLTAGFSFGPPAPLWLVEQPGLLAPAARVTLGYRIADGQGHAAFSMAIPNVPALRHLGVWFRGFDINGPLLQAAPLVGGTIR